MPSDNPKRVRTGCLKCRVRRRKCDEGKPKCQRCVEGGFECQYGTRLSFLQKNAITAQGEEAGSSGSYRRVQFVTEPSAKRSKPETARPDPRSPAADLRIIHESPLAEPKRPVTTRQSDALGTRGDHAVSPPAPAQAGPATSPQSNYSWSEGFAPVEGYEIALDALLSLGGDKSGTPTDRGHTPGYVSNPGGGVTNIDPAVAEDYVRSREGDAQVLEDQRPLGFSESEILRLLRYYRYEIAPWLDICDLGHTFGLTALCMTSVSDPVLNSLVSFTAPLAGQVGDQGGGSSQDGPDAASGSHVAQFHEADFSTKLLCRVFSVAKSILTDELGGPSCRGIDDLAAIFNASPPFIATAPLNTALYYLSLRLDLNDSLANSHPPRLPLWPPSDLPAPHRTEPATLVFRSASEILTLCARSLSLVFASPSPSNRVERWSALLDALNAWYASRNQLFRPMVEVDSKTDDFPLLLFTSGAGLMANQLYHTAMLLMLQSRPRTYRVSGARVASGMSALWHARRVCGIALANEARECWDPSLVASFVVAARGMTHAEQHETLLKKLEEVGRLTGWKVGRYRNMLLEEWAI